MKMFVLSLGLFLASVTASAQTSDIRLEMSLVPTSPTLSHVTVFVLADGTVKRSSFLPISKMMPIAAVVGQISVEEVDHIDNLIEEATGGEVITLPVHAMCFRAPDYNPEISADNGKVFLSSGSICGVQKVNTAPEAKELVEIMQKLYAKFEFRK